MFLRRNTYSLLRMGLPQFDGHQQEVVMVMQMSFHEKYKYVSYKKLSRQEAIGKS